VFGGFLGNSVGDWLGRIPHSHIYVFEPVPAFAKNIELRFPEENVEVFAWGVGQDEERREFDLRGDSTFQKGIDRFDARNGDHSVQEVLFRPASVLQLLLPQELGVMEINIEGGEYELISLLHQHGILQRVSSIFIQFHQVGILTDSLIESTRELLREKHKLVWSYDLVWEHWKLPGL
jgi:FkbM family methyltransferase